MIVQTARDIQVLIRRRISVPTVRRRLRYSGLMARSAYRGSMLTPMRCNIRLTWCRQHVRQSQRRWQSVLFTDESPFCFDGYDRRKKIWRRSSERYANCYVRETPR